MNGIQLAEIWAEQVPDPPEDRQTVVALFEGTGDYDLNFLGVFSSSEKAMAAAKKRDEDDQLGPGDEMLGNARDYTYKEFAVDTLENQ